MLLGNRMDNDPLIFTINSWPQAIYSSATAAPKPNNNTWRTQSHESNDKSANPTAFTTAYNSIQLYAAKPWQRGMRSAADTGEEGGRGRCRGHALSTSTSHTIKQWD